MIISTGAPSPVTSPLLEVDRVGKRFGGFTALNEVSVAIRAGERFGLIGPNGSGKTTLINCISGVFRTDGGRITFAGQDISRLPAYQRTRRGIARSFQIPRPFRSMSVLENLMVALDFNAATHGLGERQRRAEALRLLDRMGLGAKASASSGALSQVELRKMELARAMAAQPRLLISDEAMAGLSSAEIDEVLVLLLQLNGDGITIIMIEHIMHAVMRFSERVMCLDAGRIIAIGTPEELVADKRVQEAYLGA
jgi:branched-chain amino acid transport system ATP-binding protein